jgi:Transcription factor WhiB
MTNARAASDPLTLALLNLAARGERTHCSDPASHYLWLSEHDNERAVAAMLCDHCPVLQVCRDTAEQRDERWGVWGGSDRASDPEERRQHDRHDHPAPPIRSSQQSTHHMLGDMTTSLVSRRDDNHQTVLLLSCASDG